MANLLEYVINVRDRATATMQRLGGAAMETTSRLSGIQNQSVLVASALRELGAPIDKLKEQLDKLKQERGLIHQRDIRTIRQFNTEIQNLEREVQRLETTTSQSKLSGWAKDAFSQIPFAGLLTNPLVVAGAVAGGAIKKGIEQDLQNTSFEVLLGSKEAAQNMVSDMAEYGKNTPYDKMGLGDNAKTLLGYQMSAEKVMPVLKAIGDVAMGDKNKMDSLALAFAQMSSAGKLNGQDLGQMINAGFNPLGEMSLKTGKSISVLKDEMAKGAISAQMVEDAFMSATAEGGQFYKMAEKMGKTLGGKLSNFMDNVAEKLLIVYQVIGPVAEKLLDLGGAALDATFNGLGWLFDKLAQGEPIVVGLSLTMGALLTSMMLMKTWSLIVSGATGVMTAAQWAWNAAMTANPIGLIIAGIVALIALLGYLIYKTDGWGEAWTHTVNSVKSLWSGLTGYMALQWESFSGGIMNGIDKLIIAWQKFKGLMGDESADSQIKVIEKRIEERNNKIIGRTKQVEQDFASSWSSAKQATGSLKWNNKTLADMMGDMKKTMGISSPNDMPGTSTINSTIGGGGSDKSKSNTAITTGGTKHNYITITMNDLIGVLNIDKGSFKESTDEMEEQATDALLRVLGSAVSAGN